MNYFIQKCNYSDPHINECVKKHTEDAIPYILNGVKEFGVPKLNPLRIPDVVLINSKDLSLNMRNVTLTGFDTISIDNVDFSTEKHYFQMTLKIAEFKITGHYILKGRLLMFSLDGNGEVLMLLKGLVIPVKMNYNLITKKDGLYIKTKEMEFGNDIEDAYFNLTNLFNGNEALGHQMNIFINENWRSVKNDMEPAVMKGVSIIISKFAKALGSEIKLEDMFLI